jgi:hypothetical protein
MYSPDMDKGLSKELPELIQDLQRHSSSVRDIVKVLQHADEEKLPSYVLETIIHPRSVFGSWVSPSYGLPGTNSGASPRSFEVGVDAANITSLGLFSSEDGEYISGGGESVKLG